MPGSSGLTKIYQKSEKIQLDQQSRLVFFSDCHRGDNSRADNFAPNRDLYLKALSHYNNQGFTYVEIGDGDELWENDRFTSLVKAHGDVYRYLRNFYEAGRLYMIWGNHDIMKRNDRFVRKNLYFIQNGQLHKKEPLFPDIRVHEGLVLQYSGCPYGILVVHGHQGDLLNDRLWPIARFLVRYVWRWFQLLQRRSPLSPATNQSRLNSVENHLTSWARDNHTMIIAGHTHTTQFPRPGETPYFNDGCCVYKGHITCMEIENGQILLAKWRRKPGKNGLPVVVREVLAGPENIESYLSTFLKPDAVKPSSY